MKKPKRSKGWKAKYGDRVFVVSKEKGNKGNRKEYKSSGKKSRQRNNHQRTRNQKVQKETKQSNETKRNI